MDRQHLYFKLSGRFHSPCNCIGDVVQFKIEEDIRANRANGADDLWAFGGTKLQADFEKRDLAAQFLYEIERLFFFRDIQRDDDLVSDSCHSQRSRGIPRRYLWLASRDVSNMLDMTDMQVFSPAKINPSLKILGRRDDGFHEIETLIAPITLCDEIEVHKSDSERIEFRCDDPSVPTADDNLVVRATKALFEETKLKSGVSIEVKKKIPHGAGLGGGSSDAASTLLALNQIFETKLTRDELVKLGSTIGSDIPLFIFESAAICKGRGDLVTPINLERPL